MSPITEEALRDLLAIAYDTTPQDVGLDVRPRELIDGRCRPVLVLTVPGEQRSFGDVDELLLDLVGELHRRRARCPDDGERYLELEAALEETLRLIAARTDRWNLCFDPPDGVEVAA